MRERKFMDFPEALCYLKAGFRVAREGWNGKCQYVYLDDSGSYLAIHPTSGPEMPWVASQTDLLREDWKLVVSGGVELNRLAEYERDRKHQIRQREGAAIERELMEAHRKEAERMAGAGSKTVDTRAFGPGERELAEAHRNEAFADHVQTLLALTNVEKAIKDIGDAVVPHMRSLVSHVRKAENNISKIEARLLDECFQRREPKDHEYGDAEDVLERIYEQLGGVNARIAETNSLLKNRG